MGGRGSTWFEDFLEFFGDVVEEFISFSFSNQINLFFFLKRQNK